jgi:hypothetical protein
MLIALPVLGAMASATAEGSGIAGTWTWTYPAAAIDGPVPTEASIARSTEPGILNLGPTGHWTVDLPSAIVGCDDGKPVYSPKAAQTTIAQTFPDGSCVLYTFSSGQYVPLWRAGKPVGIVSAGPFRGSGDFR